MTAVSMISRAIVYSGHQFHPRFGPYQESIGKRIHLLEQLNTLRERDGKQSWSVETVPGEQLSAVLRTCDVARTLLVIPAGESTRLDEVFSKGECDVINNFISQGGRGYFSCGAAYWVSKRRIYTGVCEVQPDDSAVIEKISKLPLFNGVANGPLCRYPGGKYRVGFYSDAIIVEGADSQRCSVFLGGGGSFLPDAASKQKVSVVARYLPSELERIGKEKSIHPKWENAAVLASVGEGTVLLSMFHPYYGSTDIDVNAYTQAFPGSGTNWADMKKRLSPLDVRLEFAYSLLCSLEEGGSS